ncbi:MAG: hypothetical protein WC119_00980 [Synergistaceae bacterium]
MKIKISKSKWEEIGRKAGWIKTAGGWKYYSEELSDIIEGAIGVGIRNNETESEIFNRIVNDKSLLELMGQEDMSLEDLRECIQDNIETYKITGY